METKVNFKSYDGTRLVGIYQTPVNIEVKGYFLLVHGIPSDKDEWGFYKDMAVELEKNGFASLRFDLRCNGESGGGNITNLTLAGMVNDIEAAHNKLIDIVRIPLPLYVVGTSCGGGISIKWLNCFHRKAEHIFLMAPVLDYEYEIFGVDLKTPKNIDGSIPKDSQENLQRIGHLDGEIHYSLAILNEAHLFDAEFEIRHLTSGITIMQGDADTVVPYEKSLRIAKLFTDKIHLITIPNADHGFAVAGDDNLTALGTKDNHRYVYSEIIKRTRV